LVREYTGCCRLPLWLAVHGFDRSAGAAAGRCGSRQAVRGRLGGPNPSSWQPMPYKFNESLRHKIPKAKCRVTNWPEYDAALIRRGGLTVWFTEDAVAAWHATATGVRGGQPVYAPIAIETGLALRLVFRQPLRQTEGLLRSIADALEIDIAIPDHTTLSRRAGGLVILPQLVSPAEPLHLLVDSTGLKIYGEGEWLDQKHGLRARRRWRKLHLGVDASSQEIVAVEVTLDDVGDVTELPLLLDQIDASVASVTADGAYDGESVYQAVAERHPSAAVIIPPRATAVPGATIIQRDRHLAEIEEHGRIGWRRRSGYSRRSLVETATYRYKTVIGRRLQARILPNQRTEAKVGCNVLNRMTCLGMPISVRVR
jgi:transposase